MHDATLKTHVKQTNKQTLFPFQYNGYSSARASPNPPLWCPTTAVPARKQLKLSVLDGNRSFDLVNAKPARYHCTSQQKGRAAARILE
ncbi:hypothetical protein SK128_022414 [Halocaridina rubra]|uniref:Uncharacterized protein n=1 Tax=Halocaridina rubra TaxID=373956 RepID=A0AAN9A5G5_HALRR